MGSCNSKLFFKYHGCVKLKIFRFWDQKFCKMDSDFRTPFRPVCNGGLHIQYTRFKFLFVIFTVVMVVVRNFSQWVQVLFLIPALLNFQGWAFLMHSAPWIVETWPFSEFLLLVDPIFKGVVWFSKLASAIEPIAPTLTTDLKTVSQVSVRHLREFWPWLGFVNDLEFLRHFYFSIDQI